MKSINFIHSLSPQQYYALARWYTLSMLLIISTCILLCGIALQQCYTLYCAHRTQILLEQKLLLHKNNITHMHLLQAREKLLTQRQAELKAFSHNQRLAPTYLTQVTATVTPGDTITSIIFTSTHLNITINCINAQSALTTVKRLQEYPQFRNIKLVSLQPSTILGKQFTATITGSLQQPSAA